MLPDADPLPHLICSRPIGHEAGNGGYRQGEPTMLFDSSLLGADPRTPQDVRNRVTALHATLDPVRLLSDMRTAQQQLVDIADRPFVPTTVSTCAPPMEEFLAGLRMAWKAGEVRPTARPKPKQKRGRRRPDPLAKVTVQLHAWFIAEPWRTGRELLERLQAEYPGTF